MSKFKEIARRVLNELSMSTGGHSTAVLYDSLVDLLEYSDGNELLTEQTHKELQEILSIIENETPLKPTNRCGHG